MAFVMGISRAHASLLNVHEDFIDSFGVYAIVESTSFHIFCHTGFPEKSEGVWGYNYLDELSVLIRHRVLVAIFFFGNLVMTTMERMTDWRG